MIFLVHVTAKSPFVLVPTNWTNNMCLFVKQVSATSTHIKTPFTQSAITSNTISTSNSINPTTTSFVSCPSSKSLAPPLRTTNPLLKLTAPQIVDPTATNTTPDQLQVTTGGSPGSPYDHAQSFDLPILAIAAKSTGRGSTRRPKPLLDIGDVPEGQLLDMSTVIHRAVAGSPGRPPPSPLNVLASRQVSAIQTN